MELHAPFLTEAALYVVRLRTRFLRARPRTPPEEL